MTSTTAVVIGVLVTALLVGVVLFKMKKIRGRAREQSDAPDLVLTEDGRLTTVVPRKGKTGDGTSPHGPSDPTETGEKQ